MKPIPDLFSWGHFIAGEVLCTVGIGCALADELPAACVLLGAAVCVLASWMWGEAR